MWMMHILVSFQMFKAKSNKELWAFLFNDFLLLTHAAKQFTSSGPDKLFSNKNNVQLKMYKPVGDTLQVEMCSFKAAWDFILSLLMFV